MGKPRDWRARRKKQLGDVRRWLTSHMKQLVRLAVIAVPAAVVGFLVWPEGTRLPGTSVPSALFDNVLILGVARTVLLFALAYIALSIMARAWQGSWLKSVGATAAESAAESAEELRDQAIVDRRALRDAKRTIDDLTARLEDCERGKTKVDSPGSGQEPNQ